MNKDSREKKLKILIIDDDEIISSMYADLFEFNGHEVMIASSGSEGVARAVEFQPDIITLDLNMPGMDGFDVLENLKKNRVTENIPVMIASVKDSGKDIKKGIGLGACKFYVKPFSMDSLEAEIRAFVK